MRRRVRDSVPEAEDAASSPISTHAEAEANFPNADSFHVVLRCLFADLSERESLGDGAPPPDTEGGKCVAENGPRLRRIHTDCVRRASRNTSRDNNDMFGFSAHDVSCSTRNDLRTIPTRDAARIEVQNLSHIRVNPA